MGRKGEVYTDAQRRANKAWYDRNPEKSRQKSRDWYHRNREKAIARRKQWAIDNPDKVLLQKAKQKTDRAALKCHLKRQYGLTIAQRDALFAHNNGLCWCCNKRVSDSVDHDHDTGRVRGALCRQCNIGIGLIGDSCDAVMSAVLYLKSERITNGIIK
jgi:hypothetical protein